MEHFSAADVTIAVINYNGRTKIPDLFESILNLVEPPGEVIMVDDGSNDGSPDWVEAHWPDVRVIRFTENSGGMLNIVRNRALREARKPLVLIVDNDVVLLPDCLREALHGLNTLPDAAVCMTRAVYDDRPDIIYQDGQMLHYIGASPNINREASIQEVDAEPRLSIGWGVQLINTKRCEPLGWFNEAYPMGWGDDGEFNHKLNMAGLNCYHIPKSVVIHKRHSASKRYMGSVSNRWRFLLEMYSVKTLVLISPALIFYEIPLFLFLVMKKRPGDYFRGMWHMTTRLPGILRERKKIQFHRRVADRELMGCGDIFVYTDDMSSKILQLGYNFLNKALFFYWRIIRKAL
ncbi:glycosyltransferase family 2 protein [Desulfogranum japonicum]|uniref:glycosyltransferase family 2 protein n=1 Tax=Desulfogranum japonicum TaxID=231447 RepID=UPI00040FFCCC|nr:glycosyltransferase [Desulfogranum japonicum]